MTQNLSIESLKGILGREVDEIHLTIAKSSVLGLTPEIIADTLGVNKDELVDLMETQDYKDVRLLIGAEQAKERVERDFGWDGIESEALSKLGRRVKLENDTDTLLKIAAVANRATRRAAPPKENILDPSQAGARVPLTLTRRFTEKLSQTGQLLERTEVQQISVLNGSAVNPSFKEVNSLLKLGGDAGGDGTSVGHGNHGNANRNLPNVEASRIPSVLQRTSPPDDEDFSVESMRELARRISNT